MDIFKELTSYDITKLTIVGKNIYSFAAPFFGENDLFENDFANYLNDCADAKLLGVTYSWYMKSYKKGNININKTIKDLYSLISKIKYLYK
jgi:hypothetical protein